MNKREKVAFAVLGVLALSGGSYAVAAYQDNNVSNSQVIYACVTGINGNITKVSNQPHTCPKNTTPISWNMTGPKGDQGLQGIQGLQGLKGDTGPQGLQGISSSDTASLTFSNGNMDFPIVNNYASGPKLKINGLYWGFWIQGNNLHLSESPPFSGNQLDTVYFTSSDCSGTATMVSTQPLSLIQGEVISAGNRFFVPSAETNLAGEIKLGNMHSALTFSGCELFNAQSIKVGVSADLAAIDALSSGFGGDCFNLAEFIHTAVLGKESSCGIDWSSHQADLPFNQSSIGFRSSEWIFVAAELGTQPESLYVASVEDVVKPSLPETGWTYKYK